MCKEFIKNVLDVEVDGFACTVRYIVRAMYDIVGAEGHSQQSSKKLLKM